MHILKILIATVFISLAVLALEKDLVRDSNIILEEQILELSCALTEQELIALTKNVLRKSNTSYASFKNTFESSKTLIAALKVLVEKKNDPIKVYKEFELEKNGINYETWIGYSKRYSTKKQIAALEKVIPEDEESFLKMLSSSIKKTAEKYILAKTILLDYDRHHNNPTEVSDETKMSEWWTAKLTTRIYDEEYRIHLCKYIVAINMQILKNESQLEELLKQDYIKKVNDK